jgi:8-oxo-dGTP pyrophosphatase MutT (NUDIX family)
VTEAIPRRASRVLVVDEAGRVLLLHGFDPARPRHGYWFTVGGGLDPDESSVQGAVRELFEETGLRVSAEELGAPVWREVTEFPFDGQRYRQQQEFYLLRVPVWEIDTTGFNEVERASVDGYRWWTVEELAGTTERFYPAELPDLLRTVAVA